MKRNADEGLNVCLEAYTAMTEENVLNQMIFNLNILF
jgi:hypothetical protein